MGWKELTLDEAPDRIAPQCEIHVWRPPRKSYRAFLEAVGVFASAELRAVYAPRRLRIIQAIRKRIITGLLSASVLAEIEHALDSLSDGERARLVAQMEEFVDLVRAGHRADWEAVRASGSRVADGLLRAAASFLDVEAECWLANLPMLLNCGLDP